MRRCCMARRSMFVPAAASVRHDAQGESGHRHAGHLAFSAAVSGAHDVESIERGVERQLDRQQAYLDETGEYAADRWPDEL